MDKAVSDAPELEKGHPMTDTSAEAVERLAKAMYETTIDEETCPKWPPSNPEDLQYWLTIAGAAHAALSAENAALQARVAELEAALEPAPDARAEAWDEAIEAAVRAIEPHHRATLSTRRALSVAQSAIRALTNPHRKEKDDE